MDAEIEERGTPVKIWSDGLVGSFSPFPGHKGGHVVSVPIGWRLTSDESDGVLLENVYGRCLLAAEALRLARSKERGFRIISGRDPLPSYSLARLVRRLEALGWEWLKAPNYRYLWPPKGHPRYVFVGPTRWLDFGPDRRVPHWIEDEPLDQELP